MQTLPSKLKIVIGLLKGGTAKSTTAMMLAFALLLKYPHIRKILVVDADSTSQTALDWRAEADRKEGWPHKIVVIPWATKDLDKHLRQVEDEYDVIIVDTGGKNEDAFFSALKFCKLLVMPVGQSEAETRRVPATYQMALDVADRWNPDLAAIAVLTKTAGSLDAADARKDLENYVLEGGEPCPIPVAQTEIPALVRYSRAFGNVPTDVWAYGDLLEELVSDD